MPKMKSHRSAMKTYKVTANGKIKRHKAFRRHILTSKSTKRKRHLRRPGLVDKTEVRKVKRLLLA
ncbi:MAG: 50S ribosomal protein L35 [Ignavibacteria bacterium GWA2_55_11]|nr:MAG: 50S ribosomal protein L35 [Ignavibacteria bacterium GWA2_55_11]OGU44057.1 MAG: 50S ribosomal protein L35 [Ignavibacteria bacterium GWC2_56_12]OGU68358.1 MAG: 50S ribosomal protein L35 [Ignavibacteria bacterium RIFCSPHIGHO2_02_FULL_56_12]OGU71302.1 MAG: 50S ribosomal protein L35 [Ignavibacteria bacterium RIFCSPLOWO2_12_FULL_56_21]OGU75597.1 MAG: 50S ribosomal protein L35 [Ignavibacteria bacterium RIFCSPLOWO2_02_FULL_55_14]HAV24104.1 50S ribosomal protein L35 [Bacteroidota bacterium]